MSSSSYTSCSSKKSILKPAVTVASPLFKETWLPQFGFDTERDESGFINPQPSSLDEKKLSREGMDTIKAWVDQGMKLIADTKIYTLEDLPRLEHIPAETLDRGYLTRYKDPWDFHLILETAADYRLTNQNWENQFTPPPSRKKNKPFSYYESGLGLFHGIVYMLSFYMNCPSKENISRWDFNTGDLVICGVSRSPPPCEGIYGYRGVVIKETVKITPLSLKDDAQQDIIGLVVYLLDTGETRVVKKGVGYLAPLPEAFVGFPPLAVHCALHGVSPVGVEWSSLAIEKMKDLVCSNDYKFGVQLILEFYSRNPSSENESVDYHQLTVVESGLRLPRPYFLEMLASVEDPVTYKETNVNVSTALIGEGMAIGWNPFPDKPLIARTYFRPKNNHPKRAEPVTIGVSGKNGKERMESSWKPDEKQECERGLILHLYEGEGNPQHVPDLDEDNLWTEMKDLFVACEGILDGQLIKTSNGSNGSDSEDLEGNILAMRLDAKSVR